MSRPYVAIARQYEADVTSGTQPAGKWVRLAVQRNRRDLERAAEGWDYRFDEASAVKVCAFVETMPHIMGDFARPQVQPDGSMVWPTLKLEPWQCWLLTTVFGWLRVADGKRRFRIPFLLVPRKNGKSCLLAAVANYMVTTDGEAGAKCYSAATTRDQAKIVAEMTYEMAARLPEYRDYYGIKLGAKTKRTFSVPVTASSMEPLSADANTLDGLNIHFAAVDELHAHKTRHVWDVIDTATGARSQPLIFPITTAGVDTGGICYELLTYLQKILEGVHKDETFFGVNYTIDEGDDWRDPAAWAKANPNLGVSVKLDDLARKASKAEQSPSATNNFLTKHLNVWVKAESAWLPLDAWRACASDAIRPEQFKGQPCWVITDLAETRDIAATMLVFRLPGGHAACFGRYYLPQAAIETSPNAQYGGWVREGHIIQTDGDVADYARIEDDLVAWVDAFTPEAVLFDRALAGRMMQNMQARLGAKPPVLVVPQNVEVMNVAMKHAEELVFGRRLMHAGDPVLTWMVSNVVCVRNHKGEIYPRKAGGKDSHHKIDGVFALLMGLSHAIKADPPRRQSRFAKGLGTVVRADGVHGLGGQA